MTGDQLVTETVRCSSKPEAPAKDLTQRFALFPSLALQALM
jgi:hypothetical protein